MPTKYPPKINRKRREEKRSQIEALMLRLSRILVEYVELDILAEKVLEMLGRAMSVTAAAFLIVEKHRIIKVLGAGYKNGELKN